MENVLRIIKKAIPHKLFKTLQPFYHYSLAFFSALLFGFPSKKIKIVAITGTKGKTSTAELVSSVLEASGYKTALAGTLRFKIAEKSTPNLFKMTMPGRFFMQRFLRNAVRAECDWAVVEMTSEGARYYRHKFIELDALIFTNLAPEHIESHGSYELYLKAKLRLADSLSRSQKQNRIIIANGDDKEAEKFLSANAPRKAVFHLRDTGYKLTEKGVEITYKGERITSPLPGLFNVYNILAAITFAENFGISPEIIKKGIENVTAIRGRAEEIRAGQQFTVIVDYAHTPDSLRAIYEAFERRKKICVLGNTGGGRDTWKRPEMARIAEKFCEKVILTNEDPYDENPSAIVEEMANAMNRKPEIILDRREAIAHALSYAQGETAEEEGKTVVLLTGKGTDPFIMGPKGQKQKWSDSEVAKEELLKILKKNKKVIS